MVKKHSNPKCKTCIYRASKSAINGCDYIFIVGHSRGCAVKECNKYVRGQRIVRKDVLV